MSNLFARFTASLPVVSTDLFIKKPYTITNSDAVFTRVVDHKEKAAIDLVSYQVDRLSEMMDDHRTLIEVARRNNPEEFYEVIAEFRDKYNFVAANRQNPYLERDATTRTSNSPYADVDLGQEIDTVG